MVDVYSRTLSGITTQPNTICRLEFASFWITYEVSWARGIITYFCTTGLNGSTTSESISNCYPIFRHKSTPLSSVLELTSRQSTRLRGGRFWCSTIAVVNKEPITSLTFYRSSLNPNSSTHSSTSSVISHFPFIGFRRRWWWSYRTSGSTGFDNLKRSGRCRRKAVGSKSLIFEGV